MSAPGACDACLRRAWLVGSLAVPIERALGSRSGPRTQELLGLGDEELAAAVGAENREQLLRRSRERDPALLRAAVLGAGCWACCRHDPVYPISLSDLGDAPAVLFGRGDPALLARLGRDNAATVVGSRRPSAYGRERAMLLGGELAAAGLAVVSGLALGIDSCAHRGALDAGGLTVAVLGSGADVASPPRSKALYEELRATGLVLSELPPGVGARRWTFPARNRIMAALGAITIVVEARDRSGSQITADIAIELGRDVGAVPGRVGTSGAVGPNRLIRQGAALIRDGEDVLDALLGPGESRIPDSRRERPRLSEDLAVVLEAVEGGAATPDEVAGEASLDAGASAAALTRLELLGLVDCDPAGRYRPTGLAFEAA